MICLYCQAHLKGFVDSRVVVIHGYRDIACADLPACAARVAEQERAARNADRLPANPDFGPDGDAATPGFFRRRGE